MLVESNTCTWDAVANVEFYQIVIFCKGAKAFTDILDKKTISYNLSGNYNKIETGFGFNINENAPINITLKAFCGTINHNSLTKTFWFHTDHSIGCPK